MKKILLVMFMVLFVANSAFCGVFEYAFDQAEKGDVEAQFYLGWAYYHGQEVSQDYTKAVSWFTKPAEQGLALAQGMLGHMYANGQGVAKDNRRSMYWYKKAAEQGLSDSQFKLGMGYFFGEGVAQDYKQAIYWLTKSAEQGSVGAQHFLALMYYSGQGVPQDYKLALKWFTKVAEQDSHSDAAQFYLGEMFDHGRGVSQNQEKAIYWYTQAAEQGHADAQAKLGAKYFKGEDVDLDYKTALYWFTAAAEQGHIESQGFLGWMYYEGKGVVQNYQLSYVWLSLAAAQGLDKSADIRDFAAEKLSPHRLSEAQDIATKIQYKIDHPSDPQKQTSEPNDFSQKVEEIEEELFGGKIIGTGTGFFITQDGYILTCHHVVQDAARIEIYVDDKMYPASLVRGDPNNDLAILKVNGSFSAMAFSPHRSAKMGQDVFTVGYPNPGLQGVSAKYTKGTISSLSGIKDDFRFYQISIPVQPGNSGGALMDEYGNILGLVVATLDAKTALQITGNLPQSVNYAIKSLYAQAMIDTMPGATGKLLPASKSKTDAIDNAQQSTVMVVCYDKALDGRITHLPGKQEKPKHVLRKAQLYVVTEPPGGQVRVINIVEKYYDGIELDPGRYKLEGSMDGYQTKTQWVTIDRPTVMDVTLALSPVPLAPAIEEQTKPSAVQKTPRKEKQSIPAPFIAQQQDTPLPSNPTSGDIWKEPVTGMEFVWVPEGCFMMGSPLTERTAQLEIEEKPLWFRALAAASSILPYGCVASKSSYQSYFDNYGYHEDETPVHEVCLDGFWIGKYEVTQGQWEKILGNNPSYSKAGEDYPVNKVSWNDVKQYVEELNRESCHTFLLPSEAQWEYAARSGGRQETYAGGNDVNRLAWYSGNSEGKAHRVGTKAPNGLGALDMSGNVGEWCEDAYDKDAYSRHARKNPVVTTGGSVRVVRGGSWNYGATDGRTSCRLRFLSDSRSRNIGFRLTIEDDQRTKETPNRNSEPMSNEHSSLESSHDKGNDKTKKKSFKLDEAAGAVLDILLLVPWWRF